MKPREAPSASGPIQEAVPPQPTGPYHILAATVPADGRTRVLKHADTFAVFDHLGDITPGGLGEEGLFHAGTRYLSGFMCNSKTGGRSCSIPASVRTASSSPSP